MSSSRFVSRKKAKPWTGQEEEALAHAWLHVTQDPDPETYNNNNKQRNDSFWKRMLERFETQLGETDRTVHQLNSKWKDMNEKIHKFNVVYKDKMSDKGTEMSEADVLSATLIEYRTLFNSMKGFPHQGVWEIVRGNEKWNAAPRVEATRGNGKAAKRVKTCEDFNANEFGNAYTTSSDTLVDVKEDADEEDGDGFQYEEPEAEVEREVEREEETEMLRIEAKEVGSSGLGWERREERWVKIVEEFSGVNREDMEDKKRHRARMEEFKKEKLRILKEEKEKKMVVMEEELRMMRQKQMDMDMRFFIMENDGLTGAALNAVVVRKRDIAQRWGWE